VIGIKDEKLKAIYGESPESPAQFLIRCYRQGEKVFEMVIGKNFTC
jgi:hypothetical protein